MTKKDSVRFEDSKETNELVFITKGADGTVKVRELAYYGHIMRKQELSVSFIHVTFAALCQ